MFTPIIVSAQQVTNFPVCTNYQENYYPGSYDPSGNYIQGGVTTNQYNFNCVTQQPYPSQGRYSNPPAPYYNAPVYNRYNRLNSYCNPTTTILGAVLGGSIAAALANSRKDRRWAIPLGAALGGLTYSC